jgi:hypothetical protein
MSPPGLDVAAFVERGLAVMDIALAVDGGSVALHRLLTVEYEG